MACQSAICVMRTRDDDGSEDEEEEEEEEEAQDEETDMSPWESLSQIIFGST